MEVYCRSLVSQDAPHTTHSVEFIVLYRGKSQESVLALFLHAAGGVPAGFAELTLEYAVLCNLSKNQTCVAGSQTSQHKRNAVNIAHM